MKLDWQPVYDIMPNGVDKIFIGEQAVTPFGRFHVRVSTVRLEDEPTKSPYCNPFVLGHNNVHIGRFDLAIKAKEFAQQWYINTIKQLSCTSNT